MIADVISEDAPHTQWKSSFIKTIQEVSNRLSERRINSKSYIHKRSADYEKDAEKKLQADRSLAKDKTFEDRFISGYDFPPVPQLGLEFESFALSFCDSILIKIQRASVKNLPSKSVRGVLEELDKQPNSAKDLLYILRKNWRNQRDAIVNYYRDG